MPSTHQDHLRDCDGGGYSDEARCKAQRDMHDGTCWGRIDQKEAIYGGFYSSFGGLVCVGDGGLDPVRFGSTEATMEGTGHGLAGVGLRTGCGGCGDGAFLTQIHGTKVQPTEIVIFGSDVCVFAVHELIC